MNKPPPVTVFPVEKTPISIIDTSRSSEQFETARTSRVEEATSYSSMDDLVRSIRSEAGLENTPRPDSPTSVMSPYELLQETQTHVSELRIEGLAEYHLNRAAPLARIREIEECSVSSTPSSPGKNTHAVVPSDSAEQPLQVRRRTLLGRASSLPQAVVETVQFLYVAIVGALFALFSKFW
ncbi:hypothetical protein AAVH_32242 [Aphelenchoides avenae]|nr:hypothetical protein AAVH_32242 [Aphelenchus avenae]